MSSWRYFVVWIPSSLMTIVIFSRRNVERRGCGKDAVEPAAGVVDHVAGPEDADHVVAAVGPVVEEVLCEQHQRDRPPQDRYPGGRQLVHRHVDRDDRDLPQEVEADAAEPHADARHGVLGLVPGGVFVGMEAVAHDFDHGEQDEGGYRPQHDIGQVRHARTIEAGRALG